MLKFSPIIRNKNHSHRLWASAFCSEIEQIQLMLVCIISYFLSTISFSLQLHCKQPWVRGKSLRGFSLAVMTALLMSCPPSWPMAKMLLLTSLLSILFNNNLVEVVREEEKGVQHAFNIKMGKYSDRCEAEGILFSWRL